MRVVAFVACLVAVFVPARADALSQTVDVARPAGQLVVSVQGTDIVVTDTRSDDPGWTVTGVKTVVATTPQFTDGAGESYSQLVGLHGAVAHADARHGLGIASLTARQDGPTITITVI